MLQDGPEVGRTRVGPELPDEGVAAQSQRDKLAEGFLRFLRAAELPRGEVNPVEHAQLLAPGSDCRILVESESILIARVVVCEGCFANGGRRGDALEVDWVRRATGRRLGRSDVANDNVVRHPGGPVALVARG